MRNVILFILVFGLGLCVGWFFHPTPVTSPEVVTKVDTIVMRDVIHDTIYKTRTIVRELPVYHTDTINHTDTLIERVEIPINTYIFQDSTYRAEVSGYEVTLDRMEVYARTVTQTVVKRPHWALTAGVGAGVDYSGNIRPYLGVQIGYILWSR